MARSGQSAEKWDWQASITTPIFGQVPFMRINVGLGSTGSALTDYYYYIITYLTIY